MSSLKIVLLTESDSYNPSISLPYKYYGEKLCATIETIVNELNYSYDTVDLSRLDFQENESLNKFTNADIVIMDVTNRDYHPAFLYHKAFREGIDCMDDIILIQASGIENDNTIQDFKTTCIIKYLIEYQYNEEKDIFFDVTSQSTESSTLLKNNLTNILKQAAKNTRKGLSDRYFNRLEKRKNFVHDLTAERDYLWEKICDEIFTEDNQEYATPKLITQLMYAFRDIQDYQSMIKLSESCEQFEKIRNKIQANTRISYLTAFARSRRNEDNDREKALEILEHLRITKKTESQLSTDITCLSGRIYKDKYTESNCQDQFSYEKAIEWYKKGFDANPNLFAGVNLLFFLAIKTGDLKQNNDTHKIILQLNALLGKKARSLKDFTDYWDVAVYFELHAIQRDWLKACQGALHMFLLNPPIWHLKSTLNNFTILYQAKRIREPQRSREHSQTNAADENLYNFWIDFFKDAIKSNSPILEEQELPAQVPILICDNYEQTDGTAVNNIYIEAHLQLNFHTGSEPETLAIHILEQQKQIRVGDLIKKIEMNSIRSITNVKRDDRSIFLYAYENSEIFSSVELQIYFSSAERRTAFNEKMSKYRLETPIPEAKPEVDLQFECDEQGQRISLGQGTYGKVYVAQDRITMKKFAVKEIPIRNLSYKEDLENEIKILSTLNHKHIVSYYGTAIDSKKKPPIFQVIMEYVDGGNIAKHLLRHGPFSEKSIANYTRQILEGVQYLHENHILHRDIKSANILVNSKGEIKIADFGTSKRLAGLHLCTEESVGTIQYMCPDVVLVPPTGYGPAVDIWSVGCTVIEMATGKRPFHNIADRHAVAYKLAIDKQIPEIPSELSETAKDFLAKCFEATQKRPTAKDLLNHPFLKTKTGLSRETSGSHLGGKTEGSIRFSDSSSVLQRSMSEDSDMFFEPARVLDTQVSIDDYRRSKLSNILRAHEPRIVSQWMTLIEEKRETQLLNIEKLLILLLGIRDYLDKGNEDILENSLNKICDRITINNDINIRIDLERSFYLFINAVKNVLLSKYNLPPHEFFALDNITRHIAEQLVGFIRPDFRPAFKSMIPSTPNHDSQRRLSIFGNTEELPNDEIYQEYKKLTEKTHELLAQLIEMESNNQIKLKELIKKPSSNEFEFYLPDDSPMTTEELPIPPEQTNGHHQISKGIKRSRGLLDLEEEHERLLKKVQDNRTRINELLHS